MKRSCWWCGKALEATHFTLPDGRQTHHSCTHAALRYFREMHKTARPPEEVSVEGRFESLKKRGAE